MCLCFVLCPYLTWSILCYWPWSPSMHNLLYLFFFFFFSLPAYNLPCSHFMYALDSQFISYAHPSFSIPIIHGCLYLYTPIHMAPYGHWYDISMLFIHICPLMCSLYCLMPQYAADIVSHILLFIYAHWCGFIYGFLPHVPLSWLFTCFFTPDFSYLLLYPLFRPCICCYPYGYPWGSY